MSNKLIAIARSSLLFFFFANADTARAAGAPIASEEQCDAQSTSACGDSDTQSALQVQISTATAKSHVHMSTDKQEKPVLLQQPWQAPMVPAYRQLAARSCISQWSLHTQPLSQTWCAVFCEQINCKYFSRPAILKPQDPAECWTTIQGQPHGHCNELVYQNLNHASEDYVKLRPKSCITQYTEEGDYTLKQCAARCEQANCTYFSRPEEVLATHVSQCWTTTEGEPSGNCDEWVYTKLSPRPECTASALSFHTYGEGIPAFVNVWYPVINRFTVIRTFGGSSGGVLNISTDVDRAVLYARDGDCWLSFMGAESPADVASTNFFTPTNFAGISGVHGGLVAELVPLLDDMDYDQIRSECTGTLTVTGHSMGGGLAQLFSLAINKDGDPLGANLKVDFLYTIAALSVTDTEEENDKSPDHCFAGAQVWYAEKRGSTYVVDAVALPKSGGHVHVPTKSSKVLVFADGTRETFPCGTPLPSAQSLLEDTGAWNPDSGYNHARFAIWFDLHTRYIDWLDYAEPEL